MERLLPGLSKVERQVAELQGLLRSSLARDPGITLASLRRRVEVPPLDLGELAVRMPAPQWADFEPDPPRGLQRMFGGQQRYEAACHAAREEFGRAQADHGHREAERHRQVADARQAHARKVADTQREGSQGAGFEGRHDLRPRRADSAAVGACLFRRPPGEVACDILGVSQDAARDQMRAFEAAGYVERGGLAHGAGDDWWATTVKGNALANASFGKPISRATATRLLGQVIERARAREREREAARHARCCGTPSTRIELVAPGGFPAGWGQRPSTVSRSPARTRGAWAGQT